ncbi:MAG: hypothetical protein J6W51_02655 [Fibrobacter sp.]|nr:hypothetical protein [Fibrobacter sp.]
MKKFLLLIVSTFLLLTGCTNPTHVYHPLDYPEQSKGEVVKYEGAKIKMKSGNIAYESGVSDSLMLFRANRFCYDPQNDYFVFPKDKSVPRNAESDGLYFIVPRDNVTLCRNGAVKNNSYFWRNHPLHGFTMGAAVLGAAAAAGSFAMAPLLFFLSEGAGASTFIATMIGLGVVVGGTGGFLIDSAWNAGHLVDEVKESCDAYFKEEELKEFLNENLCF